MTAFATVINSSNRTADILVVRNGTTSTRLRRGERVQIGAPHDAHATVLLTAERAEANDEFVGQPAIVVNKGPTE